MKTKAVIYETRVMCPLFPTASDHFLKREAETPSKLDEEKDREKSPHTDSVCEMPSQHPMLVKFRPFGNKNKRLQKLAHRSLFENAFSYE